VRSSTSSSEITPPDGPWARTWLVALTIAGLALGGWELRLRRAGFEPTVQDGPLLWAATRARVPDDDPRAVVLIGASRIQLGIDLDEFERQTGQRPIQLAIDGSDGHPVLHSLAHRSRFAGIIVQSLAPAACRDLPDHRRGLQAEWVRFQDRASAFVPTEAHLRTMVDRRLSLRLIETRPATLARQRLRALETRPQYLLMDPDRMRGADFTRIDPAALETELVRRLRADAGRRVPLTAAAAAHHDAIDRAATRLSDRGGVLVVLRMPGRGDHERFVEELCPRAQFWDVLATDTHAIAIHYADEAALSGFVCPDGSHLDRRDRTAFTSALVEVLRRQLGARLAAP